MLPKVINFNISDIYLLPNPFLAFFDTMIFSLSFLHTVPSVIGSILVILTPTYFLFPLATQSPLQISSSAT